MATKKRFSIAPDLATGLRNTIQSASTNQGQLHYDMMSVDVIETDPENPRKLSINKNEIFDEPKNTDVDFEKKKNDLEKLHELAESIKRVGVRNAIEVYKDGNVYRIISGERRYLATILLGMKSIPARINTKPDEFNLRYMQWVENLNRQDLSLKEKYINLISMTNAYEKTKNTTITEKELQNLIGVSNSHAYRYFCLLKAEDRIIELVKSGKINNLKVVQELVSMKDKRALEQIISWINSSKSEVTSLANYKLVSGKKAVSNKSISLGKVVSVNVAKKLIDIILTDMRLSKHQSKFKAIDWTSNKSITKAFKDLFKTMENEFLENEI